MSYRPPSRPPKGAWARHLHEQRRGRDLSATQAFELVYERIGWSPKSRSAYVNIDLGDRQPTDAEAVVLAEEFGWPPEAAGDTESADPLVAALTAQTAAINALVERLDRMTAEQATASVELMRAIGAALGRAPDPPGMPDASDPATLVGAAR